MIRGKPAPAFLAVTLGLIGIFGIAGAAQAQSKRTPAPKDAVVYFHTPLNGQTVPHEFVVRIGLRNMGVAPAGVDKPNTGHHHIIIDAGLPPLNEPIPSDFNHIHLGNGQTEVRLTLPPGRHTLQLLLGDQNHVPHDPPVMSRKITIRVRPGGDGN
jgi:hypothetical protein